MKLRGIDFGNVFCASGARGFFGEGYWFHDWMHPFGLGWKGSTFVAKTMTLEPRVGNMPLREDGITPRNRAPGCIIVKPTKGVALNSVGLSNIGVGALLEKQRWQVRQDAFLLSFMAVGKTREERVREAYGFKTLMKAHQIEFHAQFGVEVNLSCPNTGHDPSHLINEAVDILAEIAELDVPIVIKINALMTPEAVADIAKRSQCDAVTVSNTIPWGALPQRIDWKGLFGTDVSPLANLGGGGLSGAPLLELVREWIIRAKEIGLPIPIIGCGGVLSLTDAVRLLIAGASAIQLGSVAFLRPWRVQGIINGINRNISEQRWS